MTPGPGALRAVTWLLLVPGCVHEYHPDYHPETTYSFVQNVVTVVQAPPPREERREVVYRDVVPEPEAPRSHPVKSPPPPRRPRPVQQAPVFAADDST
jgi:hypothetical protein